ncbi:MAG: LamG-like jellyroll fold domain-containing protein [Parvicellaceae bacterium]
MKKFYSILLKTFSALLALFALVSNANSQCSHTLSMTDSWGDGWNGASVDVYVDGVLVLNDAECSGGASTAAFTASDNEEITLNWTCGSYDWEVGWSVLDGNGVVIGSGGNGCYTGNSNDNGGFLASCPAPVACHDGGTSVDGALIEFTINDSGSDGTCCGYGENGKIAVCINAVTTLYQGNGAGSTYSIALSPGDDYAVSWVDVSTGYAYEHSYTVSIDGVVIAAGSEPISAGSGTTELCSGTGGVPALFSGVTESAGFSTCTSGSANDVTIDYTMTGVTSAKATPPSNISLSADGLIFAAPGDALPLTASGSFYARLDGGNINEGEVFTDVITLSDDDGNATAVTIPTIAAGQLPVANAVTAGNDQTVCDGTAVTLTAAHATATSPACLTFGSSSDGINCGNNSALNFSGTEITIEAWIYPTSWRTNKWEGSIINNEDNNSGYMLRCGASGTLDFNWGDNSAWNDCSSSSGALTLNTWQHVAATYDGATIKLYVDGSLVASQADVFTGQSSDNNIMIGNSEYSPSRYFPGAIDEVRVWKHSRTARDIQALMNRDLAVAQIGSASGLVGYWNMNEGVGQAIEDLSGNGGDGFAVGTWNFVPPTELQNTFSWDNSVTDGVSFSPVSTTTYTATQTTNDGCTSSNTDDVVVTVNATPTVTLNSPSACSGLTATMTANPSGGSSVYSTYTWTVPAGEAAPGNVASFDASTAGAYTVAVTDNGGCTSTDAAGTFTDAGSTYTWDGSEGTSWSDVENWSCGAVPTSSTDILIPDVTNQPVLTSSVTIASLTISSGADITISSNTLTVSGASDINGTVNIAAGATYDANGDMDASGGGAITFTGAGTLKIGAAASLGTLTSTVGTVEFDGGTAFPQDIYYNVIISSGNTHEVSGSAGWSTTVNGSFTVSSGVISINDEILDVDGTFDATGGNVTFTGAGSLKLGAAVTSLGTLTEATGTVEYNGSSQDLLAETYYNLKINGSGTKTAQGTVSVSNNLTVSAGTYAIAGTTTSVTGVSDLNGNLSIGTGTYNADGEFDAAGSISFTDAGTLALSSTVTSMGSSLTNTVGTVKYDGTSAQDVVAPSSGGYYDLAIENASTKTATANIDVNGSLTTEAEASCVFDLSTYDLNIAGNLTVGQEGGLDASDAACAVTFDGNSTVTHAGSQITSSNQELLNDGFTNLSNWTATQHYASTSWSSGSPGGSTNFSAYSGSVCAWMQENSYNYSEASISYDLPSPQTGMSVSFYYINPSWYGDIDWLDVAYYDGSTWTNIVRYSAGTSSWTSASLSIPDGATKLRFYGLLGYGYGIGLDDVIITGDGVSSINPTFNEIVVNGGDVTLADPVDVTSGLTLTSGDIISESDVNANDSQTYASTNTITLKDGATVTGGSASSHVVGAVRGESSSTTEIEFPTGDGTNYRPAYLTPSASTATTYTVEYVNASHSSIAYDGNGYNNTPVGAGIDHVAMGCWWDIEKNSGGSDAYIAITWDENSGVNIPADILLTHWNSSTNMWEDVPVATATLADATGAATASSGRIKSTSPQSDFSPWDLGSSTPDGGPLPVDLISFHTNCSHDIVDVNFSILSQVNNDKFLIERSTDAIDWEVIGEIPGVDGGFSNTQIDYVFTDNNPLANLSYYRLTQMDFDGKVETFYPVSNTCGGSTVGLPIDVYPNPAWNEVTIEMELDNYQGDDVYYTITDAAGKAAMSDYIQLNRGLNKHTLDLNKLPQGVYVLRFNQTKDHIIETRIVKR